MLNDKEHKQVYDSYLRKIKDSYSAQNTIDILYKVSTDSDLSDCDLKELLQQAFHFYRFDFMKE